MNIIVIKTKKGCGLSKEGRQREIGLLIS